MKMKTLLREVIQKEQIPLSLIANTAVHRKIQEYLRISKTNISISIVITLHMYKSVRHFNNMLCVEVSN
jgi:hypothetical protein